MQKSSRAKAILVFNGIILACILFLILLKRSHLRWQKDSDDSEEGQVEELFSQIASTMRDQNTNLTDYMKTLQSGFNWKTLDNPFVHPKSLPEKPVKSSSRRMVISAFSPLQHPPHNILQFNQNLLWRTISKTLDSICTYKLETTQSDICSDESQPSIILTEHPLKLTRRPLGKYDIAVIVVRNPVVEILSAYMKAYQTDVNRFVLYSEDFKEFALAKSVIWQRFHEYWLNESIKRKKTVVFVDWDSLIVQSEGDFERFQEKFMKVVNMKPNSQISDSAEFRERFQLIMAKAFEEMQSLWNLQALMPLELKQAIFGDNSVLTCHFGYSFQALFHIGDEQPAVIDCSTVNDINDDNAFAKAQPGESVHLVTTYFQAKEQTRQAEVNYALTRNFENAGIDRLHVWIDNPDLEVPIHEDKIEIVRTTDQPLYHDMFDYANRYLQNQIVIIQNADIHWELPDRGPTMENIRRLQKGMVFSISRHSNLTEYPETQCEGGHNRNLCLNYHGSHDAFIFIPPIDPEIVLQLTLTQNTWGAENVVIEALKHGGYQVENPCMDIMAIHSHCSNIRHTPQLHVHPPEEGQRNEYKSKMVRPKRIDEILSTP